MTLDEIREVITRQFATAPSNELVLETVDAAARTLAEVLAAEQAVVFTCRRFPGGGGGCGLTARAATAEELHRLGWRGNAEVRAICPECRIAAHEYSSSKTLVRYQRDIADWRARQPFAGAPTYRLLLGVVEEVGELSHAHLKEEDGIRGTAEELQAKARDACGDVLIFLLAYMRERGWDADEVLAETWTEVSKRDWTKNKENGR